MFPLSLGNRKPQMPFQPVHDLDDVLEKLRKEFVVDAGDILDRLFSQLGDVERGVDPDPEETLKTLRREAHTFKGQGSSFDFSSISMIAHRLEGYLEGVTEIEPHHIGDAQRFISAMSNILEEGVDPGAEACSGILRGLPAKGASKADFMPSHNYEVLVIVPNSVLLHAIEQVLNSRGLRVVTLRTPTSAFETAILCKPDLIIASAVMKGLSGIDLACAFSAMAPTRDIPFALLTSFDRNSSELRALPEECPTIRHDQDIDGQVSAVLDRLSAH